MRKIFWLIALALLGVVACKKQSFLDDKTTSLIDANAVFSDSIRTMSFLNRLYEEMPFNFIRDRWEGGNTVQGTDDSEFNLANPVRRSVALYLGNYSAQEFRHSDAWEVPWNNIRRANLLLSRLSTTPLSPTLQSRVRGEAKFMRAYFYAYLAMNFGGMPLIGDTLFGKDDNINVPRASFEETVNYIVKDLDEATALLPVPGVQAVGGYEDRDYGRVTKGSCMALKARLLLYAASPLSNGGTIAGASEEQKKVAGYPTYSVARWQAAADAADAVIRSNYYRLFVDNSKPGLGFYKVFLERVNPEFILFLNQGSNKYFEQGWNPPTRGGNNNLRPTQNIVECFPMKNGKSIKDPTSGFDPRNPYANRDPRFNYSIIFNGSRYQRANAGVDTVFTYANQPVTNPVRNLTNDAYDESVMPPGARQTGYYARKMCDSNIAQNSAGNTLRGWSLLRYAEILLSYAEAINEVGQVAKAYEKMIELRNRAGIDAGADGLYGMKPGMTVNEMREFIRNERRIELAFEGDYRWDDIRRWKIAEVVNNGKLRSIKIERTPGTMAYTYTEVLGLVPHFFAPKMYLFPIPGIEIRKMPAMIQNPGW
jgi:hypothetical protein